MLHHPHRNHHQHASLHLEKTRFHRLGRRSGRGYFCWISPVFPVRFDLHRVSPLAPLRSRHATGENQCIVFVHVPTTTPLLCLLRHLWHHLVAMMSVDGRLFEHFEADAMAAASMGALGRCVTMEAIRIRPASWPSGDCHRLGLVSEEENTRIEFLMPLGPSCSLFFRASWACLQRGCDFKYDACLPKVEENTCVPVTASRLVPADTSSTPRNGLWTRQNRRRS
ncbi:hypothetical protein LZ30DRAFT_239994 [Colletotrichum cereale]|nr:hypothetical protein LZ30DRAFT_239994 [Colletotrichum cereale]